MTGGPECSRPNRLAEAGSRYLRQHSCDPVDWMPWGAEAFEKARRLDKPVFVSVGYSSCHWCHVMQRESFSDPMVAEVLNRAFVMVKVDREERPDVDTLLMRYCAIASGSCGWPLNVLLTPDGKPFYVATYLPKESLVALAVSLERVWRERRAEVLEVAERAGGLLEQHRLAFTPGRIPRPGEILGKAVSSLEKVYDTAYGGFGRGMKFPMHHALLLLARASMAGDRRALNMLTGTLDHMLFSGVHDLVEGGLHRYSVTRDWRLPHYEKMLYDQAWIIQVLAEAYAASGDRLYLDFAVSTLEFAMSWLWTGRGFASSVDADTGEGEGAYYTFTLEEAEAEGGLPPEAIGLFNLSREGNVFEEATGARTGRNILHVGGRLDRAAEMLGLSPDRAWEVLEESRRILLRIRSRREKPGVDDKVLTDWNGMMLHALAHLYWVSRDPEVLGVAKSLKALVKDRMNGDGISHVCYSGGECVEGMLPDYAYTAAALASLYTVSGDTEALGAAKSLAKGMIDLLWSPGGGYFRLSPPGPHTPEVPAEAEDTAYPGAYATAIHALLLIHRATGWMKAREVAMKSLKRLASRLEQEPAAHATLALATLNLAPLAVEVAAPGVAEDFRVKVLESVYNPYMVIHTYMKPEDLRGLVEYAASMTTMGGSPAFYICHGGVCKEPLRDEDRALEEVMRLSKKAG
ncbi:conserved hypothetical protein [Aeropyrum pernix K1]|uniref:Spermatogenesis-associated protein 20-like TRX domain-containing protein n=1 Tax=Aeropyrum pernix (strain ATCC 700893 / DSM 11879 / JCM 9820 / NBRC 100138 / K1) TaxID=272557 RepID=Q9Y8V1_AERPE|nr:thioredoxin domain-containing protein [Aeropyrum pernix]BAA81549.2 conserved hypothetical protein [Aeropyrum pernix K1]